jgi:hypothetical protein
LARDFSQLDQQQIVAALQNKKAVCCQSPEFYHPRVNACGARRIDDRNAAQTLKVSANGASATKNAGFAEHLASIAKNMVRFGRRRLPNGLPASAAQGA